MRITQAEYVERLTRCQQAMARDGLDALIGFASRTHYGSVRYLTGYEPWLAPEEWAIAVVTPGHGSEIALLSNSPWDFWDFNRRSSTWVDDLVVGSRWVDEIAKRLPRSATRVGIAGWSSFPAPIYEGLRERYPGASFADATALIRGLRAVKSEAEIGLLRRVGELSDLAGRAFFEAAVPGATEREVVARIDAALIRGGTEQMGYFTILGSGRKTVASCFLPTDEPISEGDIVQLDCAPMVEGYKGDFSRVVVAGTSPTGAALRLVDTVAAVHEACAVTLRSGRPCSDVARAGLEVVERCGYTRDNLFKSANYPDMVFMAHGIGLENPDPPGMLTLTNTTILEPGMVINLEPILIDPAIGGARIETTYVVTEGDPVPLSTLGIRPWAEASTERAVR